MRIDILTYWKRDRSRLIGFFSISFLIMLTAKFTLVSDSKGFLSLLYILLSLYLLNIFHSSLLKGRIFKDAYSNYLLVNMWERNLKGKGSVLYAIAILLLMQFQIFYGCFLIILWFSCLFYYFEYKLNVAVHTFFDALYAIIVSGTTIGFGDIPPITNMGRLLAVLSSLVGILILRVTASCWQAIQSYA